MSSSDSSKISRRGFLTGAGLGAAGAAGAAFLSADHSPDHSDPVVPFHGEHQAGITTDAQDRMHFTAFDVVTDSRDELIEMLKKWTYMARRMTRGEQAEPDGAVPANEFAVPTDTGEALDLSPAHLTVTIGFGPSLFDDRFGLSSAKPTELQDLPHFSGDVLIDGISHGDICVQACADDPQVAVHAVRMLAKVGSGVVVVRWSQLGFGRTASTSRKQVTPRNLFGFKDGTNNLKVEDTKLVDQHVWVSGTDSWFDGGTYLIARRIRMLIEIWDRQVLADQEATFGRTKGTGAPLGREDEFDELPLDEYHNTSGPVIPLTAHARLASPQENSDARMLRRGYNFIDGSDGFGHLNAGLFFIAFVSSPNDFFIPIQSKLSKNDEMNEYVRYESSAIFACPPGLRDENDWWGRSLFEATKT